MDTLVSQQTMDLALLAFLGAVVLGCGLAGMEWAIRRLTRPEILPPPDRSARRLHLEEWEDTQ